MSVCILDQTLSGRLRLLRVLGAAVLFSASASLQAAGVGTELETPAIDTANVKSLQRGARTFFNHCSGCHSLGYQRYSRLASDLDLAEEDVEENLIFTTDESGEPTKIGSLIESRMSEEYGEQAFGIAPPNLSLTARSRGIDWIYTYLKTFYIDPDRGGVGVDNLVYPGASMPHVLAQYQGWLQPVYEEHDGTKTVAGLEVLSEGSLNAAEYDDLVVDLTNFLAYVSDPIKNTRHRIGLVVMLFLLVLLVLTYLLKAEYWKDVVKNKESAEHDSVKDS